MLLAGAHQRLEVGKVVQEERLAAGDALPRSMLRE
jgi:hypothetical protein